MRAFETAPETTAPDPDSGSRRERKKARTRRTIYDAAMALFRKRDFDGVTVEAICEMADVARGTFFHHFPSKAALAYEFGNRVAAEFEARHPDMKGDAGGQLRALVDFMIESLVADGDVLQVMIREFFSNPSALDVAHRHGRDFPDLLEQIVREGQARGELRQGIDPRLVSAMLLSTAGAILSGGVFRPGELDVAQIREQYFDLIFHGLLEAS
ncbi:MAG: TetR/AcrR family transcriptional regulator [bacterium]|nr:TetR/AcrR family transcriptional regulator [bacterium]